MKFRMLCITYMPPENLVFLFDFHKLSWFLYRRENIYIYKKKYNERDHFLYTNINLLYSSEIGLPVRPSHNSILKPNSSKCVTKRSLYATGSERGPSA